MHLNELKSNPSDLLLYAESLDVEMQFRKQDMMFACLKAC